MKVGSVMLVAIAVVCLSGCGATVDTSTETPPSPTEAVTSPPQVVNGEGILIETRITDARAHTGDVVDGSVIGEAAFCPGGTSAGSSQGATITAVFDCPDGTLTVQYEPRQFSLVQSSDWEVVSGTGSYATLRGGGSMVAAFQSDDPDSGREVFTGTVTVG